MQHRGVVFLSFTRGCAIVCKGLWCAVAPRPRALSPTLSSLSGEGGNPKSFCCSRKADGNGDVTAGAEPVSDYCLSLMFLNNVSEPGKFAW